MLALRLGTLPKGFVNWALRMLAEMIVELEIAPSISHKTLRRALRKSA